MSLSVHLLIFNLLQSNFVREADGHLVSPFLMNSWSKPILVLTLKFQLHLVCFLSNSKKSSSSLLRKKTISTSQMINPLHRLNPNTKTQNIFCRLSENLKTFLYILRRKQKEKKRFSL